MIVLGSASPRRSEIMKLMGLEFTVRPAKDEKHPDGLDGDPGEFARVSALYKAANVAERSDAGDTVIGADTVVSIDGRILGKPKDADDAFRMLKLLSGRTHTVFTGYAIIKDDRTVSGYEATLVEFREMTDDEIRAYVKTGEPMDKAGAYGIQGFGCVNVRRIEGDYFNVMGFPACTVYEKLSEIQSV